ncbi:MAG TPA: hypothetical protein RMH99_06575 [Sandaracinaceae bacterium LLY-WYZ-13_1]|nr:hypothetical protein [Sandaracinaceae bacterium LLY-WYZ-13_1]
MRRALVTGALLVLACGGADAPDPGTAEPGRPALAPLAPPGSRLSLRAPETLVRVPHTLRFVDRDRGWSLRVSDATVEPGAERALAEAYVARVRRDTDGELRHRPVSLRGREAVELTVNGPTERLRALTVWADGAVARLELRHARGEARLAEHVMDSVRFDPRAPLDPLAALDLRAAPPEGLTLLPVSNEQLLLREGAHAVPFPSAEAALDAVWVPFAEGRRPEDDRARGQLLGARFAGLEIAPPTVGPLAHEAFAGYQLATTAPRPDGDGALHLFGAYLEGRTGALLVRASVDEARAEPWQPRFSAFVASLRPRGFRPRSTGADPAR